MKTNNRRINWWWIPPCLVYMTAIWIRNGPAMVALTVVLGILLIGVALWRSKR